MRRAPGYEQRKSRSDEKRDSAALRMARAELLREAMNRSREATKSAAAQLCEWRRGSKE